MGRSQGRLHRWLEMMKPVCVVVFLLAVLAAMDDVAAGLPDGRFCIGTYCVAPYAQSESHIRDMRDCGIDFVVGLRGDAARPLLAKYGIMEIASGYIPHTPGSSKAGTYERVAGLEEFDVGGALFLRDLKASRHPSCAGLSLGDEPNAIDFPHLGKTVARTQKAVDGFPLFMNLFPAYATTTNATEKWPHAQLGVPSYAEYIDAYCRHIPLDHICWDFYLYQNPIQKFLPCFYENFAVVADACRRTGRKLRFVGQVNSPRKDFWVSENMLRFQGFTTMAFGGESIAWACWTAGWWTNQVVDANGEQTQQYAKLKKVNSELKTVACEYMRFRNVSTHFVGFPVDCPCLQRVADRPVASLDDGYVRGLSAADGDRLVVGIMVPRTDGNRERAYFVQAADDPFDKVPHVRTVRFSLAEGFKAKVVGGDGVVAIDRDANGNLCFPLASSSGAIVVVFHGGEEER